MTAEYRQQLRLLGQPTLVEHLKFIREKVVDGEFRAKAEQVDIWREANDYYHKLESSESGIAEDIEVFNMHSVLAPLAAEAQSDSHFQRTFDKLPTRFAMVELEKLVVHQMYIDSDECSTLKCVLHEELDPESLFHFCLPDRSTRESVKASRLENNRYSFSCRTESFHAHLPQLLQVEQIVGLETPQLIDNVLAIGLGHASGFLSGILAEDRVLLHEGYAKAFAMLSAGIKHAPIVLQTASRLDELELVANNTVLGNPNFYFGTPRPPLLKDFLDNNVCQEYAVYDSRTVIEINVDINTYQVRC